MRSFFTVLFLGLAVGAAEVRLQDDFSTYKEGSPAVKGWETNAVSWQVRNGQFRVDWPGRSTAFPLDRRIYRRTTVEVTVTPRRSMGKEWKVVGVGLNADDRNYWHLALVEAPPANDSKHFVELSEMREGKWLAQGNLKGTANDGGQFAWEYDTPYRLRLTLNPEGIDGKVLDMAGNQLAHMAYAFSAAAVTEGRPCLKSSWIAADFDDYQLVGDRGTARMPVPEAEKTFPAYAVKGSGRKAPIPGNGFFQVVKDGERWWYVDPRGELFYAVGTDHVNYYSHWCQELGYAPYHKNAEKIHGNVRNWSRSATERLRNWGFNLLGAGNIAEVRYQGLSHTLFVAFGSMFSSASALVEKTHWTGFPNVFDPRWEAYCDNLAKTQCFANRKDPWLLGYFLDNELEWYGKTHQEQGIWIETMKWEADHTGKQALVALVRKAHTGDLAQFNRAWEQQAESWDDVLQLKALPAVSDRAKEIQKDFLVEVADRYFRYSSAAIRKVDPNHLIIGSRFAGNAPEWAWTACAKYCDVVTFNYYPRVDMDTEDLSPVAEIYTKYYDLVNKPMMITEWSFPALDAGLPSTHGAGMRVDTQEQKTHCTEMEQHLHFRLPFMIGSDYFMWADEPKEGISDTFPENSNYGMNDVNDKPYELLTGMFTKLNPMATAIHAGEVPEGYIEKLALEGDKLLITIRNVGATPFGFSPVVRRGRDVLTAPVVYVPAGDTVTHSTNHALPPGIHVLSATLAQDKDWRPRGCRGRKELTACVFVPGPNGVARNAFAVYNPTGRDFPETHTILPLTGGRGRSEERAERLAIDGQGSKPVCWVAPEACAAQLPRLAAGQALTARLTSGIDWGPDLQFDKLPNGGFRINNGILRLEHDGKSGNVIDRFQLGDMMLGSYNPLIWQQPKDNQWTRADTFVKAELREGGEAMVVDVTSEYRGGEAITAVDEEGKMPDPAAAPAKFRVAHRFVVWKSCPYIASRLVSIRNLETDRPLRLKAYFFYLPSAIGGSPDGDEPLSGATNVPNYYRRSTGAAWYAAAAKARFGVAALGEGLVTHFWKDKGGGQHPDARVELKETPEIAPGQEFVAPADSPFALIYGANDFGSTHATWAAVERQLDAATNVKLMKP